MAEVGRKDDGTSGTGEAKLRWDLVPFGPLQEVVNVLMFGARKYGDFNWRIVLNWRARYFAAGMRHLIAWWGGQQRDQETGFHHLAHAICCFLFMIALDSAESMMPPSRPQECPFSENGMTVVTEEDFIVHERNWCGCRKEAT